MAFLGLFQSFIHGMTVFVVILIPCCIYTALYRLTFHPLAHYPGPNLWAISRLPYAYHFLRGHYPPKLLELHRKYGPVVRTAPDELSFTQEDAMQEIYGKPMPRNTQLRKDPTSLLPPPGDAGVNILYLQSDEEHARYRRIFTYGFSNKALKEQEPILNKYFDLLIRRLKENCNEPVDLTAWYNFLTFDLIGDLAFGESFQCLENSSLHFWVKNLHTAMQSISVLGLLQKFPPLDKLVFFLLRKPLTKGLREHRGLTDLKVQKRLELSGPRPDLIYYAQQQAPDSDTLTPKDFSENGSLFIIAGSDTTATFLPFCTYYLLTNLHVLAKLTKEVRTTFKSEEEINLMSVNQLEYEFAVISEGLRHFPPATSSLCRVTPKEGCTIAGEYVPGNTIVSLNHYVANHYPPNFRRPEEFIPERWLGDPEFENDKKRVVQPFSVGPRNCIGKSLALVEMKIVIARMIWNFDMELCEECRGWDKGQKSYLVPDKPPLMVRLRPVVRG